MSMLAWRFEAGSTLPVRRQIPIPTPKAHEVLIKLLAGGVCHSDVGILDPHSNLNTLPPKNGCTLGHEGAGEIAALGADVAISHPNLKIGTYVGMYAINSCYKPTCAACSSGNDNLCQDSQGGWLGIGRDGSWEEFVAVPATACVPVPADKETIRPAVVAVATDAVLTPYHAMKAACKVRPGVTIVIIGCGGLGLNAVAIASRVLHADHVIACDPRQLSLDQAIAVGADHAATPDKLVEYIKKHNLVVDTAADFCGMQSTFDLAQAAVRPGGFVHITGLMQPVLDLVPLAVMSKDITIKVSLWGTIGELAEVLQAIKEGKINPLVEERPLEDAAKVIEEMINGKLKNRVALIPPHAA